MKELTKRQHAVVNYIQSYIQDHGYPPTIREIGKNFGISVKAAFDHVRALKKKGIIRISESRSRAIEIIHETFIPKPEGVSIPLLGNITAGQPLFAEENLDRMLTVPTDMLKKGKDYYALRVQGDSMIHAGIFDGDIAVIRHDQQADNGDIIAARVHEESVTLKRFFRENNRIRLQAENPEFPPLYTQEVQILGILQMIIRDYS